MKSGIIILNKESGMSSNTAANKVKYLVGAKKAGHLGTLDVLGEGVLPITLNKATKLFNYFLKKDKTYKAIFVFGFETDTLDSEGKIIKSNYKNIKRYDIENVLNKFVGKIKQTPPNYSALKIKGKTAYARTRAGEEVNLKPREIEIYDLKLLGDLSCEQKKVVKDKFFQYHDIKLISDKNILTALDSNVFEFEIRCSSGTYIRSLCKDMGAALSTCATMLCIVRTICSGFDIKDAKTLQNIKDGNFNIINMEKTIDLPSIHIDEVKKKDILNGKQVKYLPIQEKSFKLYSGDELIGIANNMNEGILKIEFFLKEKNE